VPWDVLSEEQRELRELVRTLARGSAESGVRTWDGTDLHGARVSPGLYFVELRVGDQVDRGRIVLLN